METNDDDMPLSRASVSPHLSRLRWCGFIRSTRGGWRAPLHDIYRTIVLLLTSLYLTQQIIYAYQWRHDLETLSQVMFLLLCHLTSLCKQLVLYFDGRRIDNVIDMLNDPLYNRKGYKNLLEECRLTAAQLARIYSGMAVLTCCLWSVFPIVARARGNPVRFQVHSVIDYNNSTFGFALMIIYTHYVTTLVGIANTTMDAFIATLLAQATTQFKILRQCLKNLPDDVHEISKSSGENYETVFMRMLVPYLDHYQMILELTRSVQSVFGFAIVVQFGIGGWILCMAAYRIVSLGSQVMQTASIMLFIVCILVELFLYCYYGNELTVQSSLLLSSVYEARWEAIPHRCRRALLLVMTRAQRPVTVTAARFVPLSLSAFVTILKSSYTFYAVLRQTKD